MTDPITDAVARAVKAANVNDSQYDFSDHYAEAIATAAITAFLKAVREDEDLMDALEVAATNVRLGTRFYPRANALLDALAARAAAPSFEERDDE